MRINHIGYIWWHTWEYLDLPVNEDLLKNLNWIPWGHKAGDSNGLHCYVDDWRFESIWRNPENALRYCFNTEAIIAPDFSVPPNGPLENVAWQIFRSKQVAGYLQQNGLNVIQSITWQSAEQIEKQKELYPSLSMIAVRAPGKDYFEKWVEGALLVKKLMKPKTVLHFGTQRGMSVWDNAINLKLRSRKGH